MHVRSPTEAIDYAVSILSKTDAPNARSACSGSMAMPERRCAISRRRRLGRASSPPLRRGCARWPTTPSQVFPSCRNSRAKDATDDRPAQVSVRQVGHQPPGSESMTGEVPMDTMSKPNPGQPFTPVTFKQLDGRDITSGTSGRWQHFSSSAVSFARYASPTSRKSSKDVRPWRLSASASPPSPPTAKRRPDSLPRRRRYSSRCSTVWMRQRCAGSAQETDHRFPEPALFVVNPQGVLHLVDIANAPFLRPDLDRKAYPIRGTVK